MRATLFEPDEEGIYARVAASGPRRWLAYGMQVLLGAILVYVALAFPIAPLGLVFLLVFGVVMLWQAERLRRATTMQIVLTDADLRDTSGVVLASLSDIERVERGAFALKPSHGFTIVLRSKKPRAWAPGLWWRIGRRVGVGGVTQSGQAKFMAEQLAIRLNT